MSTQAQQDLEAAYRTAKDTLIQLARLDVNEFCAYVLRDEKTHQPIEQGPTHVEMQRLCDKHRRLILWSYTGAGKTAQIAVGRTLWVLMRNPRARVVIISNTKEMAAKIVRTVASYIETSAEYHEVAPAVRKGEPWTQTSLYLAQEDGGFAKDASVQACGIHGNLTGSRADFMIWDDILDPEVAGSPAQRADLYDWLKSAAVLGRVTPRDPIWCIGNAYHPDDPLHRFSNEGWAFARLPVVDARGQSTWPQKWTLQDIEAKREELQPLEFARQMLCRARDDSEARFKRDDLLACAARGRGLPWVHSAEELCGTPWPLPPGALDHMPAVVPGSAMHAGQRAGTPPGNVAAQAAGAGAYVTTLPGSLGGTDSEDTYAPPPLGPSMWEGSPVAQGEAQVGQGERLGGEGFAYADHADELFGGTPSARAAVPAWQPPAPADLEDDAPEWLRARQKAEACEALSPGARGALGGASRLHSRGVRLYGVLDPAPRLQGGPGPAQTAHPAQSPGHPGPASPSSLPAFEPSAALRAGVRALTTPRHPGLAADELESSERPGSPASPLDSAGPPAASVNRAWAALAGQTPHGSLVGELAAGTLTAAEGVEALAAVQAAHRLGARLSDLRDPAAGTHGTPVAHARTGAPATETGEHGAQVPGQPPRGLAAASQKPGLTTGVHVASGEGPHVEQAEGGAGDFSDHGAGLGSHATFVPRVQVARARMQWGGLAFPVDAGAWLDEWAASPGTPHRREEDAYPIHPRSVAGLRRAGVTFHTGVDLAVQRHSAADHTVLYTIAVYPARGRARPTRRVCEILRGKWYALDIVQRILNVRKRFGGRVLVENVAAQDYLLQLITDPRMGWADDDPPGAWLSGYTTGRNKASPEFGVEQLAAEFAREQWVWPVPDNWRPNDDMPDTIEQNWNEILFYDPREHTGDVLMAQWLAKESARMTETSEQRRSATVNVHTF